MRPLYDDDSHRPRPYAVGVTSPTTAPRRRNPVLVTVDILASVALLLFALGLTLVSVGYSSLFRDFTANCGDGPYPGLQCNDTALSVASFGLLAVAVLAMFIAVGMVIVRLIQKRYTFAWPLGAVIVMIVVFFAASWLAGQTVPLT
ncbi:hypothetical protein BH09ACT5_BH09ACT5_01940 [soil metagenome]